MSKARKMISVIAASAMIVSMFAGIFVSAADTPSSDAFIPGIYKGTGTGLNGNFSTFIQVDGEKIVDVFLGAHNDTAFYVNNIAFPGMRNSLIGKSSTDGVDAVTGATLSSTAIKNGAAEALLKAKTGSPIEPDETLENIPAVMWKANGDTASMMNPMLEPSHADPAVAAVRRYGTQWTAEIDLKPVSIMGIPVNGSDAEDIKTADKNKTKSDGQYTVPPVTENYRDDTKIKTVEVKLNAQKEPLPMTVYVVPMASHQEVRLKLTFGVEKDALQATISTADAKTPDKALYTDDSYTPFEAALDAAVLVNDNSEATQEQVDAANTALANATKALALKPRDRTVTTLEQLIDYTANAVNGDVIRFGADISADSEAPKSSSKRLLAIKTAVSVYGNGHTLDGVSKFGLFDVQKGGSLTVKDLIIKNACYDTTGSSAQAGSAVYTISGALALDMENVVITGCLSSQGGAVYVNKEVQTRIVDCALIGNSARTGANIYIDGDAVGTLTGNLFIGAVPVLETSNSDVNFGKANGKITVGENNIIGSVYSGYRPENIDASSVILADFNEAEYTPGSYAALRNAWTQASAATDNRETVNGYAADVRAAINGLETLWLADYHNPMAGTWISDPDEDGVTLVFKGKSDGSFEYEMQNLPDGAGYPASGTGAYLVSADKTVVSYFDFGLVKSIRFEAVDNNTLNTREIVFDEYGQPVIGAAAVFRRQGEAAFAEETPTSLTGNIFTVKKWSALIPEPDPDVGVDGYPSTWEFERDGTVVCTFLGLGEAFGLDTPDAPFTFSYTVFGDRLVLYTTSGDAHEIRVYKFEQNADKTGLTRIALEYGGIFDMGTAVPGQSFDLELINDKTALSAKLDAVKNTAKGNYTTASWDSFQTALTAALEVFADTDAEQERVDAALDALNSAYGGLTTGGGKATPVTVSPKPSGGGDSAEPSPSPPATPGKTPDNNGVRQFADAAGHWAENFIAYAVEKGLFNGTGENTFSPDENMTRGMFVTVIGRMADADVSRYTENSFSDVDENGYYARYVAWAQENGIINGIGGGLFAPDDTVTREQMAVIIYNAAEFVGVDVSGFNPVVSDIDEFTDDDGLGGWAKEAVYAMKNAGFISGKGGGVFDPKGTATRAEAAKILSMIAEYGE